MQGNKQSALKEGWKGRPCSAPARYIFAFVAMIGLFLYMVNATFTPVALPAMVRQNATPTSTDNVTSNVCYFGGANQQSSQENGEFDWSEETQSYLLTANPIGMVPSMILAGRLVEIWSPKLLTTLAMLLAVLLTVLFPIMARWSVNAVIVSQFVAGLFMGAPMPALNAMMSSWFPPEERQTLAALMLPALNLGVVASNSITGKMVDSLGWELTNYIIPAFLFAWIVLWWFLVYDTPETHPRISEEELAYIAASSNKDQSQTVSTLPWKQMLTSPPVWAHVTMALAPSWIMNTYINNLPTYMVDALHYSTTKAGYFLAIPQLCYWISTISSGFIVQWLSKKGCIRRLLSYHIFNGIATLGSAACMIAIPQLGCNEFAILLLLNIGLACSGVYMGGSRLNHMDLAINYAGTLSGLQAAMDMSGCIIAPIVNGIITNNQQTLTAWSKVFYISAAVNTFFFVVFLFFGSVEEQPWNRSESKGNEDQKTISEASTVDVVELCK